MAAKDPIFGTAVMDTVGYIHMKATRKATKEAYQAAIDELQGVWLLVKHINNNAPFYSIAIMNTQRMLQEGVDSEEYRRVANETLRELERNS